MQQVTDQSKRNHSKRPYSQANIDALLQFNEVDYYSQTTKTLSIWQHKLTHFVNSENNDRLLRLKAIQKLNLIKKINSEDLSRVNG